MAGLRRNFDDPAARAAYLDACVALDTELTDVTVSQAAQFLRNRVPALRPAWTRMYPWWSATIRDTIARPRPVPWSLVEK